MNKGPEDTKFEEGSAEDLREQALLEAGLREALHRLDPPAGFADRLMARAIAGDRPAPAGASVPDSPAAGTRSGPKILHWPMRRLWVQGAVAAALILGLFEGESVYRRIREQQRRVAEATAQFQTTERVTVRALAQAREQLQRAGVPLNLD